MTEAMSRREIEDILSSIRKLVTHDPARVAEAAAPRPETGKLVLTSALRVDAPVDRVPDNGNPETAPETHLAARVTLPGGTGAATDDAASLLARITRSVHRAEPTEAPAEPVADMAIDRPTDNIDAPPLQAEAAQSVDTDAMTEAEPLATVPVLQDWLDDADIPLDAVPADEAPPQGSEQPETVPLAELDPALEETLARLEAALSGQPPEVASVIADDDPQPEATASAPQATTATDDTPVIDEAMLYQLVANIVRQELQGELGEKITRAIRKLVRAEVARELQLRGH